MDGDLTQFSVYMTRDRRAAKAVRDLIRHYDGQVTVFRGELDKEKQDIQYDKGISYERNSPARAIIITNR